MDQKMDSEKESERLLPCPFCGGNAEPYMSPYNSDNERMGAIACPGCGAETAFFETIDQAVSAWNQREIHNAQKAEWVVMESGEIIRIDSIAMFKRGEYSASRNDWKVIVQTNHGIIIESESFCFMSFTKSIFPLIADIRNVIKSGASS